jgi:hypothetical protein
MTMPEFLQAEAERDNAKFGTNKTGADVWGEIYQSLEDDSRQIENHYKNSPQEVLKMLQNFAGEEVRDWYKTRNPRVNRGYYYVNSDGKRKWQQLPKVYFQRKNEPRPLYPIKILEVLEVRQNQTLREQNLLIRAKVVCDNGVGVKTVEYTTWSCAGTYIDPPDGETNITWTN